MILYTITGAVADLINRDRMVTAPANADERAFADHWNRRVRRNYGQGYRVTLMAPVWVFNWIMDTLDEQTNYATHGSAREIKGMKSLRADMTRDGIRKREIDGPTRIELIKAGYIIA